MKLYSVTYIYFIEYESSDTVEIYAESVAHAYQQFKKLAYTSASQKLKSWTGVCDIKEKSCFGLKNLG